MSLYSVTSAQHAPPKTPLGRRFHILCCLGYTLLCLGWNAWAGRDQSWDQLNYHLYVAHAWWHGRLPEELFAASAQGYLNPLPHLPFYAAYSTGWPSLLFTATVAAFHSINLWLLHFIAVELTGASDHPRRTLIIGGVLLGGLTPAFLIETGSSLTDVVVSIPALAALLCLFHWLRSGTGASRHSWFLLYLAGLLAGFATGLKPSALVFSAATGLAAILVANTRAWSVAWRALSSGLVGLALGGGSHALMLWQAFGNPVFPLFNKIFQSPWFIPENLVSERFRPASLIDALRYPLDLTDAFKRVGFETITVDIRPVTLISLLLALGLAALLRGKGNPRPAPLEIARSRLFWLSLALFFPAWLYTSGNTRYAVQGLLLLGPGIAWAAARLPGRGAILPLLALALPLTAQGTAAFTLNASRWAERPWSQNGFDLQIPEPLRTKPAYYLSFQIQTYAALATILPVESRFTNLVGQNTLAPGGLAWKRVRETQQARHLPWRSLYTVPMLIAPGGVPLNSLDTLDALLSEYELQTDRSDCQWMVLDGAGQPPLTWARSQAGDVLIGESFRNVIISCALVEAPPLPAEERARRNAIDARMDALESHCAHIFTPAHTVSEQRSDTQRQRLYVNTDTQLLEKNGKLFALRLKEGTLVHLDEQNEQPVSSCPEALRQARNVQSR